MWILSDESSRLYYLCNCILSEKGVYALFGVCVIDYNWNVFF